MEIISNSVNFGSFKGSGPRTINTAVRFSKNISQAVAFITGFSVGYSAYDGDEHLGNLEIRVKADKPVGSSVNVTVTYGLRDWSDDWDDAYEGHIDFAVIAD